MAVYTEKKTYHTKAHMGMIDVTEDFQHAVEEACRQHGISAGRSPASPPAAWRPDDPGVRAGQL